MADSGDDVNSPNVSNVESNFASMNRTPSMLQLITILSISSLSNLPTMGSEGEIVDDFFILIFIVIFGSLPMVKLKGNGGGV